MYSPRSLSSTLSLKPSTLKKTFSKLNNSPRALATLPAKYFSVKTNTFPSLAVMETNALRSLVHPPTTLPATTAILLNVANPSLQLLLREAS